MFQVARLYIVCLKRSSVQWTFRDISEHHIVFTHAKWSLTQWNWALFQKLTVARPLRKCRTFYGIRWFTAHSQDPTIYMKISLQ
jgi:hypothetical protein